MLSRLPVGRKIFIDSNIFIYHFLGLKDDCSQLRVRIWPLTQKAFILAQSISHGYGLLANDALNAALMRLHRVKDVATNDGDFLRVKDVKVWRPS